jgi:cell division control protein 6
MKCANISTGDVYSAYKSLCRTTQQNPLTQRRVTQLLSKIELTGLISGKMTHQGIHGNTKKFKLSMSPERAKNILKTNLDKEIIQEIL